MVEWVFVYELSGCGFESCCFNLNFRYHACFKQGVPWHTGSYRVQIHSETRSWHDNINTVMNERGYVPLNPKKTKNIRIATLPKGFISL